MTDFFLKAKERRACEVFGEENEWEAWTEAEKEKFLLCGRQLER